MVTAMCFGLKLDCRDKIEMFGVDYSDLQAKFSQNSEINHPFFTESGTVSGFLYINRN